MLQRNATDCIDLFLGDWGSGVQISPLRPIFPTTWFDVCKAVLQRAAFCKLPSVPVLNAYLSALNFHDAGRSRGTIERRQLQCTGMLRRPRMEPRRPRFARTCRRRTCAAACRKIRCGDLGFATGLLLDLGQAKAGVQDDLRGKRTSVPQAAEGGRFIRGCPHAFPRPRNRGGNASMQAQAAPIVGLAVRL